MAKSNILTTLWQAFDGCWGLGDLEEHGQDIFVDVKANEIVQRVNGGRINMLGRDLGDNVHVYTFPFADEAEVIRIVARLAKVSQTALTEARQ